MPSKSHVNKRQFCFPTFYSALRAVVSYATFHCPFIIILSIFTSMNYGEYALC